MKNGYLSTNLKKSAMYDFLSIYLKINRNKIKRDFKGKDILDQAITIAYINEHMIPNIDVIVNGKTYNI